MVKQKFLTSEMVYYKAVTLDGSKARLALGGSSKSKKSYRDATIKSLPYNSMFLTLTAAQSSPTMATC